MDGEKVQRRPTGLLPCTAALRRDELYAVIADAKPLAKPEGAGEPVRRLADVGIGEDGDDGRRGNGAVRDRHRQPSALRYPTSCSTQVFPSGSLKSANDP